MEAGFNTYLQQQKYRKSTIHEHIKNIERVEKWTTQSLLNLNMLSYTDILNYVKQLQQKGLSSATINIRLTSIKKYYTHLSTIASIKGETIVNPAGELRIKNNSKKVFQQLLSTDELEEIYLQQLKKPLWIAYKTRQSKQTHQRNIVLLGLLIYQAIQSKELKQLRKKDINLLQGFIHIPSIARSNGRTLKLHPSQVLAIQEYIKEIEEEEKNSNAEHYVFRGIVSNIKHWLFIKLKKENSLVKDMQQIRNSVIMNWLKQYNIRQVQYMVGHRSIGSTEKYKQEDLYDLQMALERFHPLK